MFVVGNFVMAMAYILHYVLNAYMWVMIIRALLSWVNPDPYNPIVRFLHNVTEPVLYAIRKRLPAFAGGVDFTPLIVVLAIAFLDRFLVQSLMGLAMRLGT